MIHLHYSNRLEALIDPIGRLVHEHQLRDPLTRTTIIVPSRAVEEFLKLRLADRHGIAANFEVPFLRGYFARLVHLASSGISVPPIKVLDAGGLQIAVFEYLRQALDANDADLAPVRAYLDAAPGDPRQRAVRLFQLSARVAWLMREYSTSRRTMLDRWPRATTLADPRLLESERWQRRIYLALFADDGTLRRAWLSSATSDSADGARWMLLPYALAALDDDSLRRHLPTRLHIFGIGYAGPEFIRIFARLGALTDLHIYTLNPCREFWEDVRNRGGRRPPRVGPLLFEHVEDPFGLDTARDNIALRYWGRAGREYIRLLNELTDCDFDEHFVEPAPVGASATLLARVQQAILIRSPEPPTDSAGPDRSHTASPDNSSASDDGGIRFLQCPGVRRELEIAADAIWSLIRRDRGSTGSSPAQPLRFHQIAIVIPEGVRDQYLAQIESVFTGAHRIPINIVDRRFASESRVAEAVDLLLKLPLGRFTRGEMVRLLTHPAVAGIDAEPHIQAWPELCRRLGVHFGADERAFADTYVEPKLYHWDYALKRLALGLFMAGEPSGETRVFRDSRGREYLPFEVTENERESVAILMRNARALMHDAQAIAATDLNLTDWRKVLMRLIADYVHPPDRAGVRVRDSIVSAIESTFPDGIRTESVPYEVVHEIVRTRISEVEAERGFYAESGVVVGSLSTLRSIPFRVTFMLGLGEADFPAREHRDPLDLRQAYRRAGDVSPAERDRYMFLETLLAARERIYLSYVSRNPLTGEELESSVVIRDLQFILRGTIGDAALERLVLSHPVSGHDRRYFADLAHPGENRDPRLETFDRNARRGAEIAALRDDLEGQCDLPSDTESSRDLIDKLGDAARAALLPRLRIVEPPAVVARNEDSRVRLSISALRHYLECPLQGAARHALGMRGDDDGDDEYDDEEPIARSALARALMLRDTFWRASGKSADLRDRYDEVCHARILSGSLPVGPFAAALRLTDLAHLDRAIAQADALEIKNLDRWQRIAVGGVEEFIDIDQALDPIVLDVDFTRADGHRVTSIELRGRVGPVSPRLDRSFKLIARKNVYTADFLEGAFGAIVLAATGSKMPAKFVAVVLGGEEKKSVTFERTIALPSQVAARAWLTQLATDLLGANNDYFLPLEAVDEILQLESQKDRAIDRAIRWIREKDRTSCRSDFGPVRKERARAFRAPLDEIRDGLIPRRFGPLIAIFARGEEQQ
jgi:exodeoxyribonuclease V gamma subunit